jgi:hypothetical protein
MIARAEAIRSGEIALGSFRTTDAQRSSSLVGRTSVEVSAAAVQQSPPPAPVLTLQSTTSTLPITGLQGSIEEDGSLTSDEPDDKACSICREDMVTPVRTRCGHIFCKQCLQSWFNGRSVWIEDR